MELECIWLSLTPPIYQDTMADFRPQDEIFRPGMAFRPLDEQAHSDFSNSI